MSEQRIACRVCWRVEVALCALHFAFCVVASLTHTHKRKRDSARNDASIRTRLLSTWLQLHLPLLWSRHQPLRISSSFPKRWLLSSPKRRRFAPSKKPSQASPWWNLTSPSRHGLEPSSSQMGTSPYLPFLQL